MNSPAQPDLFGYSAPQQPAPSDQNRGSDRYPQRPGFKTEASRVSADQIAPHAKTVRRAAIAAFVRRYPAGFTADELALATVWIATGAAFREPQP